MTTHHFPYKSLLLLALLARPAHAQIHYLWTNNVAGAASGGWDNPNNWSPNGLPATGDTADFSTLAITNVSTISLNASQTNANLIFGDVYPQGTWVVDTSGTLTLESAFGSPIISVTNQTATIQTVLLGTQGFSKLGVGTLVVSGANTYSGDTTNSAGTLILAGTSAGSADVPISSPFGVSPLVLAGGTLNVASGAGTLYNSLIVPTGAAPSMGTTVGGVGLGIAGSISGGGTINEFGSSTAGTHLSGTNSGFTGTFTSGNSSGHRVRFDSANAGSAAAAWVNNNGQTDGWGFTGMNGSTISFGSLSGSGSMRSDNGNGTMFMSIGALNTDATYSGTINANGAQLISLYKVGIGKFTLSGNNSYNGPTVISNGVLQLGAGGTAGSFGSALVTNNSQLVFSYNRADTFAFSAVLTTGTGSLAFTNLGAGIMTLNGTNSYTGDTTIAAGMIRVLRPNAIPSGSGAGNLVLNGTLDVNSNNVVLNGLSGSGIVDNVTNPVAATLTFGSNDVSSTFSGVIRNTGAALSVVKTGAGKMVLSGPNTYSGTTTVNGGELDLNTSQTGGGVVTVNAGTTLGMVVNSAASVPVATLTAASSSTLNFSGLSSTTIPPLYATNLAPTGTITLNIAGSFVSGSQYPLIKFNNYAGPGGFALGTLPAGTTANLVTNGSVIALNVSVATPLVWKGGVSSNWDIATTANWMQGAVTTTYADGQTVQFNDTANTGSVNLAATVAPAGLLVTNNSLNYTFSSLGGKGITGTSGLNKQGPGTLTLNGLTNSYTGITSIGGGTVAINADNNLGNGGSIVLNGGALSANANVTLNANRSLVVGPATGSGTGMLGAAAGQTLTFNGVIANNLAGTGSLTKTGGGTVVLAGANTYSGSTVVSAGNLSLTAAQQNGSPITVNDGATLSVTRTGGSTLPLAALTLGSVGTTTLQFGNLSSASAVITATNLTTSGTVTVSLLTGAPTLGEIPLIKYSTISGSGFAAFSLPALPAGVTAVLTNDTANKVVGLLVQHIASFTWTGTNGTTWDVGVTTNWSFLGANVTFAQGSGVVLDDTAFTNLLNLTTIASVFDLLVTNNALSYTLSGSGALSGSMALTKTGSNVLTIANLGSSTYTGGTLLEQGTLDIRSSSGLGSGPLTLAGGTLVNNSATGITLNNSVVAATNTASIIQTTGTTDGQIALNGNLTGSGTVTAINTGTGIGGIVLNGDNSGFTGTFSVSNNSTLRFWFGAPTAGSASANWILDSAGTDNQKFTFGNGSVAFGSLAGNGQLRNDGGASTVTLRVGDLNTDSTFSGIIVGNGTAQFSVLKVGTGSWTITGTETYTGNTVISNGVLALSNNVATGIDGSIAASAGITIAAGAVLDVSGRSDGTLTVGGTQRLQGGGTVNGNLSVNGTVAPGDGFNGNVGTLTAANGVSLNTTTWMKLNRGGSPSSDQIVSPVAINYGGTLVVTNVGAALQPGDTFTLFSSPTFNDSTFGAIVLPDYLSFDISNLGVNGTIQFLGYSKPAVASVDFSTLSSGSITLNATNGVPGGPVIVLTTTNLALPASAWTPIATNTFDGSGNYSGSIPADPAAPSQFYRLNVQ